MHTYQILAVAKIQLWGSCIFPASSPPGHNMFSSLLFKKSRIHLGYIVSAYVNPHQVNTSSRTNIVDICKSDWIMSYLTLIYRLFLTRQVAHGPWRSADTLETSFTNPTVLTSTRHRMAPFFFLAHEILFKLTYDLLIFRKLWFPTYF